MKMGAEVEEVHRRDCAEYFKRWTKTFCRNVKREKGTYRYRGLHWHAFSYFLEPHIEREAAIEHYAQEKESSLLVIPEEWKGRSGLRIHGIPSPDLTEFRHDLYVFPESMDWTMVFTHEVGYCGPYFTRREWCEDRSAPKYFP